MDGFIAISSVIGDEEGEDTDVSWTNEDSDQTSLSTMTSAMNRQSSWLPVKGFKTVLSNKPGKTTVIEHDIEMKEDATDSSKTIPMPQAKIEKVKQEAGTELDA